MEYKDIEKVNSVLKKTPIEKKNKKTGEVTSKNYIEVNERIKAFRMLFPHGVIKTEIISVDNGVCIIKSSICDEKGNCLATGHAYEKEGSTFINQTSYIENCETSAVGRALGMLGIGIDESVASYEEVKNAMNNQKEVKDETPASQSQREYIGRLMQLSRNGKPIYDEYMAKDERMKRGLTKSEASELISLLKGAS